MSDNGKSVKLTKSQEKVLVQMVSDAIHRDRHFSCVTSEVSGGNQFSAPTIRIDASDWESNIHVEITVTLSLEALLDLGIDTTPFTVDD